MIMALGAASPWPENALQPMPADSLLTVGLMLVEGRLDRDPESFLLTGFVRKPEAPVTFARSIVF
jgi:hypothetical protein